MLGKNITTSLQKSLLGPWSLFPNLYFWNVWMNPMPPVIAMLRGGCILDFRATFARKTTKWILIEYYMYPLANLSTENGPFEDVSPIEHGIFQPAMFLVYQSVWSKVGKTHNIRGSPNCSECSLRPGDASARVVWSLLLPSGASFPGTWGLKWVKT